MSPCLRVIAVLASLVLAGCASSKSIVDHDPDYDFTGKHTYAWMEGIPAENPLHEKRIAAGVDDALVARGYQRIEGATPDLWVFTEVEGRRELRSTGGSVHLGLGHSSGMSHYGLGTSVGDQLYEVAVGTLVISIADGTTQEVVWRASAERTVTDDPERAAKAIREAIESAFSEFPPGK